MVDHQATRPAANSEPARLILLGASNLTKGLATAVATSSALLGADLELFIAHGHGRSYGRPTTFFGRELPGIMQSRLWDALGAKPGRATPVGDRALVTDIGNDLMYEAPVETIAAWLEDCFDRLAALQTQTVVSELPVCNFPRVTERTFRLFRRLFFPRCALTRLELIRRGEILNEKVKKLAAARNFFLATPRAEWYGLDPIHVRRGMRRRAWRELFAPLASMPSRCAVNSASALDWLYLRSRMPAQYRRFGAAKECRQPSGRLASGVVLHLF